MKSYFSPLVDRYLRNWIGPSTWDSMHSCDMRRFYQFIQALTRYGRKDPLADLGSVLFLAAKERHPNLDDRHIDETLEQYEQIARHIIHYLKAPFPDPLVEMRDPFEVSLYLRRLSKTDENGQSHPFFSPEEREEILEKNFGKEWRNDPKWRK